MNMPVLVSRPRRFFGRTIAWGAGIAVFLALAWRGAWKCPTAALFHVPCPTCGATRSVRALMHLDFAGVLRFNPFAIILVPILAGIFWRILALVLRDGSMSRLDEEKLGRFFLLALFWSVIASFVFWGLRFFGWFGGPCPV
jgi:hypothetical protein